MQMEDMLRVLSAMMNNSSDDSDSNAENPSGSQSRSGSDSHDSEDSDTGDFSGFFNNINFDMLGKMGELFSHMNKPDMNGELLLALKPHLREENRYKIDTALKLSTMISLFPVIKESGILNDLF